MFKFKFLGAMMFLPLCVVFFTADTAFALPPRIGQVVILQAHANNSYVTVNSNQLIANGTAQTADNFKLVDADGLGEFALQRMTLNGGNRYYVSASPALTASGTELGAAQTFRIDDLGNNNIALWSPTNNSYVCADNTFSWDLIANRTSVGAWETFTMTVVDPVLRGGEIIALQETVGKTYLRVDNDSSIVTASSLPGDISPWFEVIDVGGGVIALRSWQTNCYLHADFDTNAHRSFQYLHFDKNLVVAANSLPALDQWERFRVKDYNASDGSFRLVTEIYKKYLQVYKNLHSLTPTTPRLYADGTASNGTRFTKSTQGGLYCALQKINDNFFITAPPQGLLDAHHSAVASQWEKFKLVDCGNGNYSLYSENGTGMFVRGFDYYNTPLTADAANNNSTNAQFKLVNAGFDIFCMQSVTTPYYYICVQANNLVATQLNKYSGQGFRLTNVMPWMNPAAIRPYVGKTMSLKSRSNYMYASANPNGTTPVIANSSSIGTWEKYSIEDGGNGMVAFKALSNSKYVSTPNLGTSPLVASSLTINDSTRFRIVDAGGIKVHIIADKNHKYISLNTSNQLVASTEGSPGPKDTFEMIYSPPAGTQSYYGALVGYESALYGSGPYFIWKGVNGTQRSVPQYSYPPLSQGKSGGNVNASSGTASYAFDGNESTLWSTTSNGHSQWLWVDLGALYNISGFEIIWGSTGFDYKYYIETSADGTDWGTVRLIDRTGDNRGRSNFGEKKQYIELSNEPENLDLARLEAAANKRYVRITITSPNNPSLYEFKVRGYNDAIKQKYWNNYVEQLNASGVDFVILNTCGKPVVPGNAQYVNVWGDPGDVKFLIKAIQNFPGGCNLKIASYPFELRLLLTKNLEDPSIQSYTTFPPLDFADFNNFTTYFWDRDLRIFYDTVQYYDPSGDLLFKVNGQPFMYLWSISNNSWFINQNSASSFCAAMKSYIYRYHWGTPYILADPSWSNGAQLGDIDAYYNWPTGGDPWAFYDNNGTKDASAMTSLWNNILQPKWNSVLNRYDTTRGSNEYIDPDNGRTFARALNQMKGEGTFINILEGFTNFGEGNFLSRIKDGTYEQRDVTYPNQRLNILRRSTNNPSTQNLRYQAEACDFFYHSITKAGNVYREGNIEIEENNMNGGGWDVFDMKNTDWLEWEEVPLKGGNVYFNLTYSASSDQKVQFFVDGSAISNSVTVKQTNNGAWNTSVNIASTNISNDKPHTVKILVTTGGNLKIDNWTWNN